MGMIDPFVERSVFPRTGMSYGLDPCGYSVRIAQDVYLPAHGFALASTIERFVMPDWIAGEVKDKSSLARLGISMFNTHIDPGWEGYLTLEITNQRDFSQRLVAGQPIAQILFVQLAERTEQPYSGKYQNQPDRPVEAIKEKTK
jgi:dCTP deaminase